MLSIAAGPALAADKSAAMVIDANTGRVLHDNSGSEPRYPASLTKMMTLYMAFETIEAGRLSFATPLTISERAAAAAPSKIGLKAGSQIAMRDAIKALIVKSANDMSVAIAEKIGGSEEGFARLMTKRARQIGMRDTTFRNASGLPDSGQVTTARDMLTLAMRMQDDFPQHYRLFSTRTFSYGGKTYRSHNALLGRFAGVDGIKTGYTRASGFNLVSSYKAGGKHVVAAVFGGVSAGLRDAHMRMILTRSIEKASTERTRKAGPQLIAQAKPAKRPAPQPVIKPTAPEPPPAATVAEAPIALQQDTIAQVLSENARIAAAPRIDIAKVKTVPVLPPPAADTTASVETSPAADAATAETPDMPTPAPQPLTYASTMPRPDFVALKAQLAARAAAEPAAPETEPSSLDLPRAAPPPEAPASDTETVLSKAADRARPPSTLQAQLASLEQPDLRSAPESNAGATPALQRAVADLPAPMPVPVSLGRARSPGHSPAARPGPETAPAAASGYHVQIGVYGSPTDAERAMAAAKLKAAHVLGESAPIAMPLTKGDRQLYRARFAGFDSASATSACNELRRNGLDCFVARAN